MINLLRTWASLISVLDASPTVHLSSWVSHAFSKHPCPWTILNTPPWLHSLCLHSSMTTFFLLTFLHGYAPLYLCSSMITLLCSYIPPWLHSSMLIFLPAYIPPCLLILCFHLTLGLSFTWPTHTFLVLPRPLFPHTQTILTLLPSLLQPLLPLFHTCPAIFIPHCIHSSYSMPQSQEIHLHSLCSPCRTLTACPCLSAIHQHLTSSTMIVHSLLFTAFLMLHAASNLPISHLHHKVPHHPVFHLCSEPSPGIHDILSPLQLLKIQPNLILNYFT